jgi:hypothetical protein
MKHMSIFLKNILLFSMLVLSGCVHLGKAPISLPATLVDLQSEVQQLRDVIELQHKQFSQQQTDLTTQLNTDFKNMHKEFSMLDRKINTLNATTPTTVVISDEECPAPPPGQTPDGKLLLGSAEWVWLNAANQAFNTRIDTGADTSSISAADITIFERNSKKWVSFYISHQDISERIQIKAPLVRRVRVRQASTKEFDRRPVVLLSVRVSDQNEKAEFSLTDRSNMKYPMLLGRDFLKDIAMVDVARTYIQPKPRLEDAR